MNPGRLIRETRARHGLSQQRLARRVGSDQSAISRLEADEVSPSVETLEPLMAAMGERLELGCARRGGRLVSEPEAPLDAERILRALDEHGVDYVLIGGLAVQTHDHVRTTNDADLMPAPDRANLGRLAMALRSLAAAPRTSPTSPR